MADIISSLIKKEEERQQDSINLIASENYPSRQVREALASRLSSKYSEGYPGKRYYQGNAIIDEIESLAIGRAKKLFEVPHANVQAYSGAPANSAVYFGLLNAGEKIMGMNLPSGGHLTHGHPKITFSGKYFESVQYGVNRDGFIDYEELEKLVKEEKPKLIVAGTTAYTRTLNWKKFGEIADSVDAILLADISHIAGLVVSGVHPSPVDFADVITTTTHKTLRGPRGALIMVTTKGMKKDPEMSKKIDRAVFPGLQGGPHDNQTAAIAIALEEASRASFKEYGKRVIENAKALAEELEKYDFKLVTGGTDNHIILVDLRSKNISGKDAAILLEKAGIVTNANSIPHDPAPPMNPSGIRLGTPAVTSRGMRKKETILIAGWINDVISDRKNTGEVKKKVLALTKKFPLP